MKGRLESCQNCGSFETDYVIVVVVVVVVVVVQISCLAEFYRE